MILQETNRNVNRNSSTTTDNSIFVYAAFVYQLNTQKNKHKPICRINNDKSALLMIREKRNETQFA